MSLILEGLALAIEGAALVIDCACCIREGCDLRACVTESDCDEAATEPGIECYCRGGRCTSNPSCVDDDDCPDGYVCIDGRCVPPCRGQECVSDADCPEECECIEGGCWDPELVYYCWKQVKDEQGNDIPEADQEKQCKKGVPTPPMYASAGGPYLSYSLCAASGCDAKFSCNPVAEDCFPDPAGPYESLFECQSECGGGGDTEGRCCESVVCYDADGEVISVVQGCAETAPDPVTGQDRQCCGDCDSPPTSACPKSICISDPPLQNGQAGCRTFRQFNALFSNCDLCPTVDIGPCCHLDEEDKEVCSMVDRGECEEVLNGVWKGNNWFDCENARDPDVDLLYDFACPNCNGIGDCSCEDGEFCFANRCNSCQNPNANPTKTGTVTEVRFDDYTTIDPEPQLYRKYYFRVLTCQGQNAEELRREPVAIYGRNIKTPDQLDLLIIVSNDPLIVDSRGYTTYEDDQCYIEIVAKKPDGIPARIGLCYFWQDPPIINGNCPWDEMGYTCECLGDPAFECPNCHPEAGLEFETYTWKVITPQEIPPQEGACYEVNPCARRWFENSTKAWFRETWSYVWPGNFDANTFERVRDRLIVLMPDGTLQDVTDEWVTGKAVGVYSDCLVRARSSVCDDVDEFGEPICDNCEGSECESPLGIEPPAAPPDPLGICTINRNLNDPNPLP